MSTSPLTSTPEVGLFVTCLVDLMRPSVGFAAVKLLEDAGCVVHVPTSQTCCGQPAYNSGDRKDTKAIACQVIEAFEGFDATVAPSGSCAGMIKHHYPTLFDQDDPWHGRALALAEKTHELISYLVDVRRVEDLGAQFNRSVTYHDSCSGLRELGIKEQPRALMNKVKNLTLNEHELAETCCGFGGLFCVKYPDISEQMVDKKAADVIATGADCLLAGDMGCLLNMAGRLKRKGSAVEVRHIAEVLADMTEAPSIAEGME